MSLLVDILRHSRRRGFGIQSPWAYQMVRSVLYSPYTYYNIERLRDSNPSLSAAEWKEFETAFRLANHIQPSYVIDFTGKNDAFVDYVKAGCTKVLAVDYPSDFDGKQAVLLRLSADSLSKISLDELLKRLSDSSALIVENIDKAKNIDNNNNADSIFSLWQHPRTAATFDMKHFAVVFLDRSRSTEHYFI